VRDGVVRVLGLISGTSVDGVDAAVADFRFDGELLRMRRRGEVTLAWPGDLRTRTLQAIGGEDASPARLSRLDRDLGVALGELAVTALHRLGLDAVDGLDLVASHGQTLHHAVAEDGGVEATWQIGLPAEIAERVGVPVVADFRVRDVAAGGQGAPLVPILDELLLSGRPDIVAALNLGGIANLTVVRPAQETVAFDCGPANALLDVAMQRATGAVHDEGGLRAARGRADPALLDVLLADPFLAQSPPKSTGRERYHAGYLDEALAQAPVADLADLLATLAEAVAAAVAAAAAQLGVRRLWASGGGVHNAGLWQALERRLRDHDIALATTDDIGLPVDHKEAYAFALLGALTWHGLPGNVPSCTGAAGTRVLGTLVPGEGPLHLPAPAAAAPTRLRIDT